MNYLCIIYVLFMYYYVLFMYYLCIIMYYLCIIYVLFMYYLFISMCCVLKETVTLQLKHRLFVF